MWDEERFMYAEGGWMLRYVRPQPSQRELTNCTSVASGGVRPAKTR